MDFVIADAGAADAEAVLEVKDQCWREAYAHLLPEEFLARLGDEPGRTERWRSILAGDAGGRFALARSAGRPIGLAGAGPAQDDDAPVPEVVYTLYVLAEAHGTGLAEALMEHVIGRRPAFLWVFEDNPRARAFYSKLGFEHDGARRIEDIGGTSLAEIRMVRGETDRR